MAEKETTRIRRGFSEVEVSEDLNEDRITITLQKCKHIHGEGYEPVGPKRVIYEGARHETRLIYELLHEAYEDSIAP